MGKRGRAQERANSPEGRAWKGPDKGEWPGEALRPPITKCVTISLFPSAEDTGGGALAGELVLNISVGLLSPLNVSVWEVLSGGPDTFNH